MRKLILRRFTAFCLDYLIIAAYALFLFGITKVLNSKELDLTPISGQLLGFVSLTLPVLLYFYLTEKSKSRATIGKKIMNISIGSKSEDAKPRILLRNILKFLPWEIAHTGVHWTVFYSKYENDMPIWVWILLITPQVIMVIYIVSIIISKGESGIYDKIANSKIKVTSVQHSI